MTVYEKKNAKGHGTGLFVIEVTVRGQRHRETTRDRQEAERRNAELTRVGPLERVVPERVPAPTVYTVGKLKAQAVNVCWEGQKDLDQSIQRFEAVCDILGSDTPLAKVRTAALDDVVQALTERSLAPKTVHRYLAAFSKALRWAATRDHIPGMPIIPWPKVSKGKDTVLDRADEDRMLAQLRKSGSPDVLLIMEVLLATGARIGEVCGLHPDDIDIAGEEVTFLDTKNGEDRTVPLQEDLARRLMALATVGMPSYRRISLAIHRAARLAGVTYKVTPHVFRHTAGTRLSDGGVAVPTIARLLGHKNERTTMGYIHPEKDTIRQASALLRRTPRGATEGQTGGKAARPSGNRFQDHPTDNPEKLSVFRGKLVEASPRIELGFKDLQCDIQLSETAVPQVLRKDNVPDGS